MWRSAILFALALTACDGDDQPPPPPPVTFGSAAVTWTLQDLSGTELDCSDLSISIASISLGPDRFEVPCGDEQRVLFDRLTPGIYGVTLSLDVTGRGQLLSQTDNVQVVAGQEAQLDMIVEIDTGTLDNGRIKFTWTVVGQPAPIGCGMVMAETVHIETTPSSIAQFAADEDCASGEVVVAMLRPGLYQVNAEMRDAGGARVGQPFRVTVRVMEAEDSEQAIPFVEVSGEPGSFLGLWTITSTAPDACEDVSADTVRVSLRTLPTGMMGVEIASATVACEVGSQRFDNLPAGPDSAPLRASFTLISDFLGPLATETSTVRIFEGETSTITVRFDVQ